MILLVGRNDAGLQHIRVDKCLTNVVRIFTLLFEVILGFSKIAYNLGTKVPSIFVWSNKHEYDFDRCVSN
jgi:hypothetical protein